MSKYFENLDEDMIYRITKSSNPDFINKDFIVKYTIDHENYHLEKKNENLNFTNDNTKIVFDKPRLYIKILIFNGGNIIKPEFPNIRENFICSFSEGNFRNFLKDNQIEYEISKEYAKKLIKDYKGQIAIIKEKYGLTDGDL